MKVDPSVVRTFSNLLKEATAIFFGVAVALAGQAWFENRADRVHEREMLQAVLQEMELNQRSTNRGLSEVRKRREELQTFYEFLGTADAASSPASVTNEAAQLLITYAPYVVSPALEYALGADNLRLIQDPDLRQMLTNYQDRIRRQREFTDDHQDWTNQTVRSFVIRNAYLDESELANALGTTFPVARFRENGEQLINSREFDNLVLDQIFWHLTIERGMSSNAEALPDFMAQLSSKL